MSLRFHGNLPSLLNCYSFFCHVCWIGQPQQQLANLKKNIWMSSPTLHRLWCYPFSCFIFIMGWLIATFFFVLFCLGEQPSYELLLFLLVYCHFHILLFSSVILLTLYHRDPSLGGCEYHSIIIISAFRGRIKKIMDVASAAAVDGY